MERADRQLKVLAWINVIGTYLYPWLLFRESQTSGSESTDITMVLTPLVLGIINLIFVLTHRGKMSSRGLLTASVTIKYGLIPFYVLGGIMIAFCWGISIIPVPFMIFLGPVMVVILTVFGYFSILMAAPVTMAALKKAAEEHRISGAGSVIGRIFQFFFVLDVVTIMVLCYKEKQHQKLTTVVIIILVLLIILLIAALVAAGIYLFKR